MGPAAWTWMVYLAGDNNLEGAGNDDLKEMQQVGSSERVNVIVQFDTEVKGTTRYRVEENALATIEKMPGVDTGDPEVLAKFIQWTIAKYPAEHYLVDIWNHGGGWENLPPDYDYEELRSTKPARAARLKRLKRSVFRTTAVEILKRPPLNGALSRAVAIDTGSHDYLDNQELKHALSNGFGPMSKADIFGCDACLMNMLEIAYEMRTTAQYMVGSEQTEPNAGWPYAAILNKLAARPNMSPADLARTIAQEYGAWYQARGTGADGSATQSALNLGKLSNIVTAVDDLARTLIGSGLWPLAPPWLRRVVRRVRGPNRLLAFLDDEFIRRTHVEDRIRRPPPDPRCPNRTQNEFCQWLWNGDAAYGHELDERIHALAGIEARHPFLDRRLIEFCVAIPEDQRWRNGQTKFVLRNAMTNLLPECVRMRLTKGDYSYTFLRAFDACGGER